MGSKSAHHVMALRAPCVVVVVVAAATAAAVVVVGVVESCWRSDVIRILLESYGSHTVLESDWHFTGILMGFPLY
eukprot:8267353-Pyramimonas_sp.AAC.1